MTAMKSINIRDIIDKNPIRPIQYWIFAICILVAIIDGFDFSIAGAAGPTLIAQGLVDTRTFGYVLSAGLFGFVPGMLIFGPMADRRGPKRVLIIAIATFAVGSLLTALSSDLRGLIAARFLTGVGLGGASPCFVSLASDYAPQRARTTVVTTLWAGVPGGGIIGGMVAGFCLQVTGWQTMFFAASLVPMLVMVLVLFTIPESLTYMMRSPNQKQNLTNTINRLYPHENEGVKNIQWNFLDIPQSARPKSPVRALFTNRQILVTLPLWLAAFSSLCQTAMLGQYTPVLLKMSGMSTSQVSTVFSFFYVGSVVGTIAAGPVISRMSHTKGTIALLICAAIGSAAFGFATHSWILSLFGIVAAGLTAAAGFGAIVALAAELYPGTVRATGVGWTLAMSRVGASVGPLLSGPLLTSHISHTAYYAVVGCLALIGAAATAIIHKNLGQRVESAGDSHLPQPSIR